jgi:hypothetical protein
MAMAGMVAGLAEVKADEVVGSSDRSLTLTVL